MERIYREDVLLRASHMDFMNTWKPSAILEVMQEAAGRHAEDIGFGRNAILPQGLVWAVTRLEVEMDRYPHHGETVHVETFPTATRRWFFPRYFLFKDQKGHELGRAGSLWVLMDLKTRKMVKPDAMAALLPDNSDLPAPMGLPATVYEVGGVSVPGTYVPQYADLDMNGHVNNTRYMDLCCNALGIETMRTQCLHRFAVNYSNEIRPGQILQTELRQLNRDFSFSGISEVGRHFDVGGELMDRP